MLTEMIQGEILMECIYTLLVVCWSNSFAHRNKMLTEVIQGKNLINYQPTKKAYKTALTKKRHTTTII